MANSTRYYQLTDGILLEYLYVDMESDTTGDSTDRIIDLSEKNRMYAINNNFDGKRYLYFRDGDGDNKTGNNINNLVVPINQNGSKFVKMKNEKTDLEYYSINSDNLERKEITFEDNDSCDVFFDKCIIHFTGANYFGDYDSLILQVFVKDFDDSEISLANILIKRTDDVELNERPILINNRLYTTHISFKIPSTKAMLDTRWSEFTKKVSRFEKLKKNTPVEFNILGTRSTYSTGNFLFFNTEQLNSIHVPNFDSYKKVNVVIEEADDGDYFKIYSRVDAGGKNAMSFSDYIESLDLNPSEFIIMHEINLFENTVNLRNETNIKKTHTEYYIVNMSVNEDDNELDDVITYRPVCLYSNTAVSFTIEDTLRIINTEDNTTIVKRSSFTFDNPKKYGKKINKLFNDFSPLQVNVYNKRVDEDLDSVKISKVGSSSAKLENHQYYISSMVECTNIGVSIQQLSSNLVE